jgi:hypothetical protein
VGGKVETSNVGVSLGLAVGMLNSGMLNSGNFILVGKGVETGASMISQQYGANKTYASIQ